MSRAAAIVEAIIRRARAQGDTGRVVYQDRHGRAVRTEQPPTPATDPACRTAAEVDVVIAGLPVRGNCL